MKQKQNKATATQAAAAIARAKSKIAQINSKTLRKSLENMIGRLGTNSEKFNLDTVVAMAKEIEQLADSVLSWENQQKIKAQDETKQSSTTVLINEIDYSPAKAQLEKAIAEIEQEQKSRLKNKNKL